MKLDKPVKIFLREDYGSFGQVVSTGEAQPADVVWAAKTVRDGGARGDPRSRGGKGETLGRSTATEQVRCR
jgi:hypothetical protein